MSLNLGQRAFRASLSAAQHVKLQQRSLTRLTGARSTAYCQYTTTLNICAKECSLAWTRPVTALLGSISPWAEKSCSVELTLVQTGYPPCASLDGSVMACTCQTWLAGRVDQEAHAEEDITQTAELDPAGSRQSQGSRPGRRISPEKRAESPVLNGSSRSPAKPAASATAPPQQPASKLPAACGTAYAM